MTRIETELWLFGLVVIVALAVTVLVRLGRWWRRRLLLTGFVLAVAADSFGAPAVLVAGAAAAVGAVVWRWCRPGSFRRLVAGPVRRSQRRAWYRQHWTDLTAAHGLTRERGRGKDRVTIVPPRVGRIHCGPWCDRLWVRPVVGQSIEDWERQIDALAMALGARACRVALERPGLVRLEVIHHDPLGGVVPALAVPELVDLAAVPIGIREDGTPWTVRLTGTHLLVAGVTGAGKSSVVWSLIRGVASLVAAGVVQLWAVDPKGGMELAPGQPLFSRFAGSTVEDMVELLEAAVATMRERAARYAGHHRSHKPSVAEPLVVVIVDEMAFLTAYIGDRGLRDRVNKALAVLLTQGRAVGVFVVAALQDPRKEVLSYRNLFPTKIALRLDERTQVDMVLGDGARDAGARCDLIPDTSPGVAYVKVDGIREPQRVRAGFVTDDDIAELAARYPAPPVPAVEDRGEAA